MKKLLLFLTFLAFAPTSFSQIYFSEDFTFGIPSAFTLYNLDSLTPAQPELISLKDSAWIVREINAQGYWGSNAAIATSWMLDTIGPVDDWMVTPIITIGNDAILKWTALSITSSGLHRSNYQVYLSVSASLNDLQNATLLYQVVDTGESVFPVIHYIDLSAYSGLNRCLAFRNYNYGFSLIHNSIGANTLMIDDIVIYESVLSAPQQNRALMKLYRDGDKYVLYSTVNMQYTLINLQGRMIETNYSLANQYQSIDLNQLAPGIYLLQCTANDVVETYKLIR